MPTKTDIANIALAKFREGRIANIESNTDSVAVVMNDQYDHALELLLEEHRWNFAGKRVTLTQSSDKPPFGWDYKYQLPSDIIRLKDVNGEDVESSSRQYVVEGDKLLINDDKVTITYTAKVNDCNLFSPSFTEALALKLASLVCGRLTGDTDLAMLLDRQYSVAVAKSMNSDAKVAGSRDRNLMQRMMEQAPILGGTYRHSGSRRSSTGSGSSSGGTVSAHKHELTDLLKTGAADGQTIIWNDVDGQWEAGTITGSGLGDVNKVGTPLDNQVGVWTGDGTIEGNNNFTWNGSTLEVDGNIATTGTFNGRDLGVDGAKLDNPVLADVLDKLAWNNTDLTFDIDTGTGTIVQIGQEVLVKVRNTTGVTIPNGSAVRITGASGNRPTIVLAQADTLANADGLIGLSTVDISNNSVGFVAVHGLVRGLNTSLFSEGDEIFLSSTLAGGFTNIEPPLAIPMGTVTYSNPSNGTIFVKVDNTKHLHEFASDPALVGNFDKDVWKTKLELPAEIGVACSDETTDLAVLTAATTFRMPYAMELEDVRINVNTAPTGASILVDVKQDGTTILSTPIEITAGTKSSAFSIGANSTLTENSEITVDITQVGSTTAGKGLKIWLLGHR